MKLLQNYFDDDVNSIYIRDINKQYWFIPNIEFNSALNWDIEDFIKIDITNKEEILRIFE